MTPFGPAGSLQVKVIFGPCKLLGGTSTEDKDIGALGAGRIQNDTKNNNDVCVLNNN